MKASLAAGSVLAAVAACWLVPRLLDPRPPAEHITASPVPCGRSGSFVVNLGQWPEPVRYLARFGAMTVFLEEHGWRFTLVSRRVHDLPAEPGRSLAAGCAARGVAVQMRFAGPRATPALVAEGLLPGRHHYFLGNDPSCWRSDVLLHESVCYRGIYPGIDVRVREQDGHFEFDVCLEPGADVADVEIEVDGHDALCIDATGALVLHTALGPVSMPPPPTYERAQDGASYSIECRYEVRGPNRFGFLVDDRRPDWALVIDPGLIWSTFVGGTGSDAAQAVVVGGQGSVTTTGSTGSVDYPTTLGAFDTSHNNFNDVFVTRLAASGASLVFSTFLGGSSTDAGYALALDAQGGVVIAGGTTSLDFPASLGAFDSTFNGANHTGTGDAFVARLSADGSALTYATYLGGAFGDLAAAVHVGARGEATVGGFTESVDFPTTPGAFDRSHDGLEDGFVVRLSASGATLDYATFLGGQGADQVRGLHVDPSGVASIAGSTASIDFPTTSGAYARTYRGSIDAFLARLSADGSTLSYSTFFGGTGTDWAVGIACDEQGVATILGATGSADLPTTAGAFDTTYNGGLDLFVARIPGATLAYGTFIGGTEHDSPSGIAWDARRATLVAGGTGSFDFPTTPGAVDRAGSGWGKAFVLRLSPPGTRVEYSTLLGGDRGDTAFAVAADAMGFATVAGRTGSNNFPTTAGALDRTHNGDTDVFVTRLDLLPDGVLAFGRSSSGCNGPLPVSVTSMPRVGNAGFGVVCGNAPITGHGVFILSAVRLASPLVLLGVELWVDPAAWLASANVRSDQVGACEVVMPIPNNPNLAGWRLSTQFVWMGPASPPPCPPLGWSASNAIEITIQP